MPPLQTEVEPWVRSSHDALDSAGVLGRGVIVAGGAFSLLSVVAIINKATVG